MCVVEVRFPIVHQPPPLEQVRSGIGGLDLVLDDVRQRRLHDFTRLIRFLGGPISERRPEAVRHGGDRVLLEHLGQRRRGYRPAAPHREHEPVAVAERARRVEYLDRPAAEREAVLALRARLQARVQSRQGASCVSGARRPVLRAGLEKPTAEVARVETPTTAADAQHGAFWAAIPVSAMHDHIMRRCCTRELTDSWSGEKILLSLYWRF